MNVIPGLDKSDVNIFSGSRDGSICMHDVMTRRSLKVIQGKEAITSLALDDKRSMLWYGTASSNINCLKVAPMKENEGSKQPLLGSQVSWQFPDPDEEIKVDIDENEDVKRQPDFYIPGK